MRLSPNLVLYCLLFVSQNLYTLYIQSFIYLCLSQPPPILSLRKLNLLQHLLELKTVNSIYFYFLSHFYSIFHFFFYFELRVRSWHDIIHNYHKLLYDVTQKNIEDSRTIMSYYMSIACNIHILQNRLGLVWYRLLAKCI